jgi:hypothetical protein
MLEQIIDSYGGEWPVDFRGRNRSGPYNQNFLWRRDSVYVMDNHRAAFWCWLQRIDPRKFLYETAIDDKIFARHPPCRKPFLEPLSNSVPREPS